ncbi:MAG TPA: hypothetical protein VJX30_03205, partial [Terriglobales bacterium]|nr:hypothetical protein [Terriglobales bacterium]
RCRDSWNSVVAVLNLVGGGWAFVRSRGSQFALLGLAALLLVLAAYSWFCYVAQGIAYGAIVGLRGRELDLAAMGSRAIRFLGLALCSEALAIGAIWWVFADDGRPTWLRLSIALGLATVANVGTYVVVRGL